MNGNNDIPKLHAEGYANRILEQRGALEHDTRGDLPMFYRFVVIDVIFDTRVIDDDKIYYWENTLKVSNMMYAPVLPRNTIIAKRIFNESTSGEEPMFLFPFFPSHLAMPCKPGEHVWVMFESPGTHNRDIGYWFCKIVEPGFVDDVNHTHAPRAYDPSTGAGTKDLHDGVDQVVEFRNGQRRSQDGKNYTAVRSTVIRNESETAYEKLLTESDACKLMKYEPIPRYRKRPGDIALEGSNNAIIVLGTDRNGIVADITTFDPQKGKLPKQPDNDLDGTETGMIDIVAGRGQTDKTLGKIVTSKRIDDTDFNKEIGKSKKDVVENEGDPDLKNDRSRVLVAQRTMTDKNLGLDKFNKEFKGVKDPDKGSGTIVIKSDKVRIMARMDVEILVTGFENDDKGRPKSLENPDKFAAIIIKSNGDIVFRPAKQGVIKLGGDDANLAVLCTPATNIAGGAIIGNLIRDNWGGVHGAGGDNGQWASKVLIK